MKFTAHGNPLSKAEVAWAMCERLLCLTRVEPHTAPQVREGRQRPIRIGAVAGSTSVPFDRVVPSLAHTRTPRALAVLAAVAIVPSGG